MASFYSDHPDIVKIALTAFPDYVGRKFRVDVCEHSINVKSYWDGGSITYYSFVRLDTLQIFSIPQQSAFDKQIEGAESVKLIPGLCCVKHTIFRSKDMGCTILVHPDNAPKYLPAPVEMSDDEKRVLYCTKAYKSFARLQYSRMTPEAWAVTKAALINRKLLEKNGAINNDGRNAIGDWKPL